MSQPGNDKKPDTSAAISEAIRRKREHKNTLGGGLGADLEALEASLLADIEAFDSRAVTAAPADLEWLQRPVTAEPDRHFPPIVPEGTARPAVATKPQASVPPPPAASAPSAPPAVEKPGGPSLLERLRQEARARQNDDVAKKQEQTALSRNLDKALRQIFAYAHDLVQQLNVLRPAVERTYSMFGSIEFSNLEWQKGFVDYRTQPESAGSAYELVTLSCHLAAADKLRLERDAISADSFRKALFDNGVVFTFDEIRNARQMVEKVAFSISAEVKINLRWRADLEKGAVILEARNLERFGTLSYALAPETVNSTMLDEFGSLLLGQPNRFRDYIKR